MTDEQIEEEAESYGVDLCCICRECDVGDTNPCHHKRDAMYGYKEGYREGLKAGRPKWHDLRKDPDDLPPPLEFGSLSISVLTDKGHEAYFDYDDDCWEEDPAGCEIDPPVAWCEIPKFEEVEK